LLLDGGQGPQLGSVRPNPELSQKAGQADWTSWGFEQHLGRSYPRRPGRVLVKDHECHLEDPLRPPDTVLDGRLTAAGGIGSATRWPLPGTQPPVPRGPAGRIVVEKDMTIQDHPEISRFSGRHDEPEPSCPGSPSGHAEGCTPGPRLLRPPAAGKIWPRKKPFCYMTSALRPKSTGRPGRVSAGPAQVGGFGLGHLVFITIAVLTATATGSVPAVTCGWLSRTLRRERASPPSTTRDPRNNTRSRRVILDPSRRE